MLPAGLGVGCGRRGQQIPTLASWAEEGVLSLGLDVSKGEGLCRFVACWGEEQDRIPPPRGYSPRLCLPLESVGRSTTVPPAPLACGVPFERAGGDIYGCGGGRHCRMHMGKLRHGAVQGVTSWSRDPGGSPPPPDTCSGSHLPSSPLDAAVLGPDAGGHHVGTTGRALGWVQGRRGVTITASGPQTPPMLTLSCWRGGFLRHNGVGVGVRLA